MKKKQYIKPAQRIVVLQHQSHLLLVSGKNQVQSLRDGCFNGFRGDEDYGGGAR